MKIENIFTRGWLCVSVTFFIITALVRADEKNRTEEGGRPGLFLRMGVGVRAMSMGGAFVALANDPSATFWNAAGLAQLRRPQLEFMNMRMPYDRMLNFFSGVIPVQNIGHIGFSWMGLQVHGIESRTGNTPDPDFVFSNNQHAFLFSLGRRVGEVLSMGGSAKFLLHELGEDSATGFGFDVAMLLKISPRLSLGMVAQDVGTDLRWRSGFTEAVPLTIRLGGSYKLLPGMVLNADLQKTLHEKPEFRVGTEFFLTDQLPIMIGYNQQQIAGGAGLILPLGEHLLKLHYGYANDRIINASIHRFSLIFAFGKKSLGISRRNTSTRDFSARTNVQKRQEQAEKIGIITARRLNVRSGPGIGFRKITQLKKGQRVEILQSRNRWHQIKLSGGKTGWVHANYVKVE